VRLGDTVQQLDVVLVVAVAEEGLASLDATGNNVVRPVRKE
jgi:hypothetical protein